MSRLFAAIGALLFVASLVYFGVSYVWWFGDVAAQPPHANGVAIAIDLLLFSAFALHHSIFARLRVKGWIERHASPELERPIYVWIASILFLAVCVLWQPVGVTFWHTSGLTAALLTTVQIAGAGLTLAAARQLDVLALAGLRPAADVRENRTGADGPEIIDTGLYGLVRHPIYLGWFVMVWCAPVMNGTRMVFAIVSCAYLAIAIPFEERELVRTFGEAYGRY